MKRPPVIDGRILPEEWPDDAAATLRMDTAEQCQADSRARWKGPSDASAVVRVAVDGEALYLAASVTDDVSFHPGEPWWEGDALEVFLNTDLSDDGPGTEDSYNDDDWQLFFMPANPGVRWGVAFHGRQARFDDGGLVGVKTAFTAGQGGSYDLEVRIPLSNFPGLAGGGEKTIGFDVALDDVDRLAPGAGQGAKPVPLPATYLTWNKGFALYQHPHAFGRLVLPARAPAPAAAAAPEPTGSVALLVAAIAALLLVVGLVGPGSRLLARAGPRPKAALLLLDILLGAGIAFTASRTEEHARASAHDRIDRAVEAAGAVAREADEVGALDAQDPSARARVLARLLAGQTVPCVPPVSGQAYVPLSAAWNGREVTTAIRYAIPLAQGTDETWPLAAPTPADAIRLTLAPPETASEGRGPLPQESRIGVLYATAADGSVEEMPVSARLGGAPGEQTVTLRRAGPSSTLRSPLLRLRYVHDASAPSAILTSISTLRADGTEAAILLPSFTEDRIPVLARADSPDARSPLRLKLLPGGESEVPLPDLVGADRLWLVIAAERAFPARGAPRHGATVAEIVLSFESGPPTKVSVENGDDIDDEALIHAIKHPADMRSRVAYRWREADGITHHHDLLSIAMDPRRKPMSMVVRNLGDAGEFTVAAATLTKRVTDVPGGKLAVAPDALNGRDTAFLRDPRPFAEAIAARTGDAVRVTASVGSDARKTSVSFSAALPDDVVGLRDRKETAILTCLVLAAFLLVLLAVDLFEAFHRLSLRLVTGVLLASLLPVAVTIVLVDRWNSSRLEAERVDRVRGWLFALSTAMTSEAQKAQVGAQGLREVVSSLGDKTDSIELKKAVSIYRRSAILGGASAAVVVRGRSLPTLTIEPETRGARVDGPAFLADHTEAPGLYASPWDGLLLVGTAKSDGEEWRKVILGTRVDGDFVRDRLAATLPGTPGAPGAPGAPGIEDADDAEVVILTRSGESAGASGRGGDGFARALSALLPGLAAGGADSTVLSSVATPAGPRLAVLSPLASAQSPDVPAAWIAVGVPRRALDAEILVLREELVGLGLAAAVLVACVAALLARRIAGPVRDLVRVTDAVRRGEFDVAVGAHGSDEIGDLAVAFDQMRRELKSRLGDLGFLRGAQEAVASSLDLVKTCEAGLQLFRARWSPDLSVLLMALSPTGPVVVRAEAGRKNPSSDLPIEPSPRGWVLEALRAAEPIVIERATEDPRVKAEGTAANRLIEDRNAWIAIPLRAGGEGQGIVVLAWSSVEALPTIEARATMTPLAGIVALALHNARLYRLAALDEATTLPGSTAFESALGKDVQAALAGGPAAVVLRVGLDHLDRVGRKSVEAERAWLRAAADAVRALMTGRAQAGRLREDEFGIRLAGATRDEALAFGNAVRERLAAVEIRPDDGGDAIRTGISVGIARCPEDATSVEFLLDAAGRALANARREGGDRVQDVRRVDAGLVTVPPFEDGAVFRTERMVRVVETARRIARTDSTVLLTGETGTGKEVIADLIHRRSARGEKPFVKVNCAAFPETLLESELFGHERGAFTGADRRREGRFELADGGTLFLDEVGEMALSAQVKLLRVLQEGQFTRLGGTRPVDVSVRIIAATNQELEKAVKSGAFREDLYYRLNVLRIEIPPLRERREEIPALVDHFLAEARAKIGHGPSRLSPQAMDVLYRHPWPGNVRELRNVLERCAVMTEGDVAGPEHLHLDPPRNAEGSGAPPVAAPLDSLNERQRKLLEHLAAHGRCTNREFIEMTTSSPRTGLRDLQELIAKGLIVREGKRRGAVYRLP